jgi:vacuolar-type H+-ATPase subunit I/STV1
MEKTNIEHLKDIIKELKIYDSQKATEAEEFLEAIENELTDSEDEMQTIKERNAELNSEIDTLEGGGSYDNNDFVGLDTINWSLEKGNLAIQQRMESFIERLQKENCVGVPY